MNKYPSTVTATHLFRAAFCLVITISLAFVGSMLGQTKSSQHPLNYPGHVNLSLAPVPDGASGELVSNGGFETGDFTDWTQSGDTSNDGVDMSSAHSGTFGAFFGAVGSVSFITQDLTTTVGNLYDLTFWLANGGGTPNHFEVSWDGGILDSIDDGPFMDFTRYSFSGLEATTTSTELQFGFRQDPDFWLLDDISVRLHATKAPTDFNHDTHPDLVFFNRSMRRTAIWFLDTNNFTGSMFGPTLPVGWDLIDSTDFDNDGNVDYALFNATTRRTAIWYLDGTSFLSSAFGPTLPAGWALVQTGDFNGDEHPDFVLFNATSRRTSVWFLNNNVFTGSAFGPTLPSGWRGVGVADFNRDGRSDVALFNSATRRTAIWYLHGTSFVSSAFGPTTPSGWDLIGVSDFNLDGAPDYLLFNATTRRTAIWYLNNNVFVSSAFGPTTPAGWQLVAP